MISTVIRNLLSNAIKFSHENSTVRIKAQNAADCVRVSFQDKGIGMLQEDISKLFRIDINYTTLGTHKEKGTGLGLILAKEMIEKNGGEIFVNSRLGQGSTFEFTLPRRIPTKIE
jgi:signal transduction histidine kinase